MLAQLATLYDYPFYLTPVHYFPFGETEGPGPGEMGIESDAKSEGGRPSPEDIEDRVANLMMQKEKFRHQFEQSVWQIEDLIDGKDEEGIGQYYEGWTAEDLETLLSKVRGEQEEE